MGICNGSAQNEKVYCLGRGLARNKNPLGGLAAKLLMMCILVNPGLLMAGTNDWLGAVPGTRLISALLLPGTHDAAAYAGVGEPLDPECWVETYWVAQVGDIGAQLNAGVRALDIRFNRVPNSNDPLIEYQLHHGSCEFTTNLETHVLDVVQSFLLANPSETVFVVLVPGQMTNIEPELARSELSLLLENYSAIIYQKPSAMPWTEVTLGDVRGKMVLLEREGGDGGVPNIVTGSGTAYDHSNWAINYDGTDFVIQDSHDLGILLDCSSSLTVPLAAKKTLAEGNALAAQQNQWHDMFYVNYMSAHGSLIPVCINEIATDMNGWLWAVMLSKNMSESKLSGMYPMDFISQPLGAMAISELIANNSIDAGNRYDIALVNDKGIPNDTISSISITGATVQLFEHADFGGASVTLSDAQSGNLYVGMDFNDRLSSLRIFPTQAAWEVKLYEHGDYGGTMYYISNETMQLPDVHTYEAEDTSNPLGHAVGRQDGDGWSANTAQDSQGHMIYGPYATDFGNGNKRVNFRTLVDNTTAGGYVAYLDVFDATTQTVLAGRAVARSEFAAPMTYQDVTLDFALDASRLNHTIEVRMWWYDISYVKVDKVIVTYR